MANILYVTRNNIILIVAMEKLGSQKYKPSIITYSQIG